LPQASKMYQLKSLASLSFANEVHKRIESLLFTTMHKTKCC
jgi:hypothetical protein